MTKDAIDEISQPYAQELARQVDELEAENEELRKSLVLEVKKRMKLEEEFFRLKWPSPDRVD